MPLRDQSHRRVVALWHRGRRISGETPCARCSTDRASGASRRDVDDHATANLLPARPHRNAVVAREGPRPRAALPGGRGRARGTAACGRACARRCPPSVHAAGSMANARGGARLAPTWRSTSSTKQPARRGGAGQAGGSRTRDATSMGLWPQGASDNEFRLRRTGRTSLRRPSMQHAASSVGGRNRFSKHDGKPTRFASQRGRRHDRAGGHCLRALRAAPAASPAAASSGEERPLRRGTFVQLEGSRQHHELLTTDPQARPYRVRVPPAYVADGDEFVSRVRVCVAESGDVADVDVLRPSIAAVDEQLPEVISRWHYRPYLVEGQATAFCYPMNYRVH